jgi:hypothetical protein
MEDSKRKNLKRKYQIKKLKQNFKRIRKKKIILM